MSQTAFRNAILKHQRNRMSANLMWGPPLPANFVVLAEEGCKGLRDLGYFANLFPEGDGITFSHSEYTQKNALQDVRFIFPWLHIKDGVHSLASLYGERTIKCKILVPIEKLHLTLEIHAQPYRFIPAIGDDEHEISHPWHEYLSARSVEEIKQMRVLSQKRDAFGITEETLLAYPLIELSLDIPYKELCTANETLDGMTPLLRRCVEYADRGLDLLRLDHCDYNRPEHLPATAGQLRGELGLHAAFVIPEETSPFKPKIYCHFASPFQVMPNWLGLEVGHCIRPLICDLAPIVFSPGISEMSQRLRGAIRAVGQALYMITPEARFISLVSAIEGLCAPKKKWREIAHHAYITAIAASGDASQFKVHLQRFNEAYTNIRNPIIHRGGSFIELNIEPDMPSSCMMELINLCISSIFTHNIETVESLHAYAINSLKSHAFELVLSDFISDFNEEQPDRKPLKMPRW